MCMIDLDPPKTDAEHALPPHPRCFGERGMHLQPADRHHPPLAAGLFGAGAAAWCELPAAAEPRMVHGVRFAG